MQKRFAMKLADALESGKYEQTTDRLCHIKPDGSKAFCCLGVACELSGIRKRTSSIDLTYLSKPVQGSQFVYGNSAIGDLPKSLVKKYAFHNSEGFRRDNEDIKFPNRSASYRSLAHANDCGVTFKEIADYIRVNYKDL